MSDCIVQVYCFCDYKFSLIYVKYNTIRKWEEKDLEQKEEEIRRTVKWGLVSAAAPQTQRPAGRARRGEDWRPVAGRCAWEHRQGETEKSSARSEPWGGSWPALTPGLWGSVEWKQFHKTSISDKVILHLWCRETNRTALQSCLSRGKNKGMGQNAKNIQHSSLTWLTQVPAASPASTALAPSVPPACKMKTLETWKRQSRILWFLFCLFVNANSQLLPLLPLEFPSFFCVPFSFPPLLCSPLCPFPFSPSLPAVTHFRSCWIVSVLTWVNKGWPLYTEHLC